MALWGETVTLLDLSYGLMAINVCGGCLLLWLLKNGRRPALQGIRWTLRVLACIPLVGMGLNIVQQRDLLPLALLSPLRVCIGYTLMGVSIWGFVAWLLRQRRPGADH